MSIPIALDEVVRLGKLRERDVLVRVAFDLGCYRCALVMKQRFDLLCR
jgi:hypothetical protein